MISLTYLPLCVTMPFRGMPDIWKGRHQLILCWLVCMQDLSPGQTTLEELVRWTPAPLTGWRFRRLLQASSWSIHLLGTWWAEEALQTLPPPKDGTLHLNRSTHHWHTLRSVRCAHGCVSLALFVRIAHATQGSPEIRVYESLVV
jgi:hypothetical protein